MRYITILNNVFASLLLFIMAVAGSFFLLYRNVILASKGFDVDLENNAATESGREFEFRDAEK